VMVFDGQVRSGMSMVGNARYFEDGSLSMLMGNPYCVGRKEAACRWIKMFLGKAWGEAPRFSPAVVH
jgi:hypothetical protein